MQNIFTVDVEDWFNGFPPEYLKGKSFAPRLEYGMNFLLDALDNAGIKATFFWVGVQAEAYPNLLRQTHSRGHEIGCHSYDHRPVFLQEPEAFEGDTGKAMAVLSDITGSKITSYRAPYFSITQSTFWALDILASLGITHDSSILPMHHWRTGIPDAQEKIHPIDTPGGTIIEVPVTMRNFFGVKLPTSGGGYFRAYPYGIIRSNISGCDADHKPAVFYIHPWELDPDQPRMQRRWIPELMHYIGLNSARTKLLRLLGDHSFGPLQLVADEYLHASGGEDLFQNELHLSPNLP